MRRAALTLISGLWLLALPGCIYTYFPGEEPPPPPHGGYSGDRHYGPPPHAPSHGYYRHRSGPQLQFVFDDALGVFAVVGHSDHYYFEGRYYRWWDGAWQASVRIDDGWNRCGERELPERLGKRHAKRAKRHHGDHRDDDDHRGHGRGHGDHDDDDDDDDRGWPAHYGRDRDD